jgi:enoyl-CoA hydratase/carnithine racemase
MWLALLECINGLPGSVRIILIDADGPSFSAGLDRSLLARDSAIAVAARAGDMVTEAAIAQYQEAFGSLRRPGIVSVALVQGHAIGAGFQLALACDLRIAAADATFVMAETGLGLVPDLGGTKRLVELLGYSRAVEICLTGRPVKADEALSIGLVNTVTSTDRLTAEGSEIVQTLLAKPRTAMIETKALLLAAADRSTEDQERAERGAQARQLRELFGIDAED